MQILIESIMRTIPSWGFLSALLFLLWFISATVGRSLFGETGDPHFASLSDSLISNFIVITGGEWTSILLFDMNAISP